MYRNRNSFTCIWTKFRHDFFSSQKREKKANRVAYPYLANDMRKCALARKTICGWLFCLGLLISFYFLFCRFCCFFSLLLFARGISAHFAFNICQLIHNSIVSINCFKCKMIIYVVLSARCWYCLYVCGAHLAYPFGFAHMNGVFIVCGAQCVREFFSCFSFHSVQRSEMLT